MNNSRHRQADVNYKRVVFCTMYRSNNGNKKKLLRPAFAIEAGRHATLFLLFSCPCRPVIDPCPICRVNPPPGILKLCIPNADPQSLAVLQVLHAITAVSARVFIPRCKDVQRGLLFFPGFAPGEPLLWRVCGPQSSASGRPCGCGQLQFNGPALQLMKRLRRCSGRL